MAKVRIVRDAAGGFYGLKLMCPGCRWPDGRPDAHILQVAPPAGEVESVASVGKPRWGWNGSFDAPTFTPSLLTWWGEEGTERYHRCHSFITDGKIQFLDDCTHALKGQTVELPDITDGDE
jgi:hypothetical protein